MEALEALAVAAIALSGLLVFALMIWAGQHQS
jgi:hypothetical protein